MNFKQALIATTLIFCSIQLFAQDYASTIDLYRQQKKATFLQNKFGPLQEDQIDLLRYFSADEQYKLVATVEILFGERTFRMPTYDGSSTEYIKFAVLTFQVNGQDHQLTAYKNISLLQNPKYKDYLFVPFKDHTNGQDTYEGGRYVELDATTIQNGKTVIDFNKAYNPYCAYSNGYRCPIPPSENHLETAIFAGEQKYNGPKNERPVNKNTIERFSETERQIILSDNATVPLHVYQTTEEREAAVLKNVSKDIDPQDTLLQVLAQRMLATVQDPGHIGVGIAAPQVGISKNIIWVQRHDKVERPFELYINPKIIWRSKLMRKGAEGCLSIPDRREDIERSYTIRIQYWTVEGEIKEENVEGFTAVIFQHEVDHLYGILFSDRLDEQMQKERVLLNEKLQFFIEKGDVLP
ncbi:MAG TPA: peptide deformylase [Sphingobacterium sp.]|nr:peptide deformylase [Sphingobacterium sp.]